jgi:hypothetical protein
MADEFKLDTTFTGANRNLRPAGVIFAAAGILIILLTVTTNFAEWMLPMDETYLLALVPRAADGTEALSLQMLSQEASDTALTVNGTVMNRTEFAISDLQAEIQIQDRFGFTVNTVNIPLEPREVPSQETATFLSTIMLQEPLSGYSLKFKLADGPYIAHKDDRAASFSITPSP